MSTFFKYKLTSEEVQEIKVFCDSIEYCSIDQVIEWNNISNQSKDCYFLKFDDDNKLVSFCIINESKFSGTINFGPVCSDKEIMVESISSIIDYYKKKKYLHLGIQMYMKVGFDSEYIEYQLNKKYKIKYYFNSSNTKSSLEIDLHLSNEDIFKSFSKGHKSSIKKAQKLGLKVEVIKNNSELISFADLYSKMCRVRKIHDDSVNANTIIPIYEFLKGSEKGEIMLVKDSDDVIIGGGIFVYQGVSVRYYKGTSDPDKRDFPIAHILLYEAILKAKEDGFQFFDFWGYNHFVGKNDQVYSINIFKKGFGGYLTFFPKKLNINLFPFGHQIISTLRIVKNLIFSKN